MCFAGEAGDGGNGIGDKIFRLYIFIGNAIDETGIRTVFQQASNEIRQKIFMRTDRCIDATRNCQIIFANHFGIQIMTHAVQALIFVIRQADIFCDLINRGNRMRVMGSKHRINNIAGLQHFFGAGDVTHIGVGLAGEHRIVSIAFHLGFLDFGIPVRAFD